MLKFTKMLRKTLLTAGSDRGKLASEGEVYVIE